MHIAFLHEIFPFGGGQKATEALALALTAARADISVSIIAPEIRATSPGPRITMVQTPCADNELPYTMARLGVDLLILPEHTEARRLELLRSQCPGLRIVHIIHSLPLWQRTNKMLQSPVKALRERVLHTYTRRYTRLYRRVYSLTDLVVTLCPAYRREMERIVGITPGEPSHIVDIPNPFDYTLFDRARTTPKRREVLYVGRLSRPDKQLDSLLRIWARVEAAEPEWTLRLVGNGPDEEPLRRLAEHLGLKRVEFCGYQTDPRPFLATAAIHVLTSRFEGWPISLMEAMASAVAPVAFDCCAGVHEMLGHGRGILITPGREGAYADALLRLMRTPRLRADMADRALTFLPDFTPRHIATRWLSLPLLTTPLTPPIHSEQTTPNSFFKSTDRRSGGMKSEITDWGTS